jgi:hypothetical protein
MRVTLVHEASRRRLELEVIASKNSRKAIKNYVTVFHIVGFYFSIFLGVTEMSKYRSDS